LRRPPDGRVLAPPQAWRQTHERVSPCAQRDAPILPELLDQIPAREEIASVTADGAYDTRRCHDAVADRGAHAVMPSRKNAKP
jgi:hypothetical protein